MNPLLVKEIRLLLPAFAMALLLAVVPVWLLRKADEPAGIAVYLYGFGVATLALSSFGREFGLKTFALILAQPYSRRRIWWTKIAVLACAIVLAFGAWFLSCQANGETAFGNSLGETVTLGGIISLVMLAGGLWTAILLRQIAAAFWFTVLIPAAIAAIVTHSGGGERGACVALGLYAVTGFWWAGRQFLRAEETAWTGGMVAFAKPQAAHSGPTRRMRRPIAALIAKELQLQQVVLAGMGGLFLLHLGVLALRKASHDELGSMTRVALECVWLLWFPVPLLAGVTSVADERKLGTMQGLLCEPISSRVQFLIKLVFVVLPGALLSALLLWIVEGIGTAIGASTFNSDFGRAFDPESLVMLFFLFVAIALIGFYASTLARNLMQALAIGTVTALVFALPFIVVGSLSSVFGIPSWRWGLLKYIEWPVLVGTLLWLAYSNFRPFLEDSRLVFRNIVGLIAAVVFIPTITVSAYHRVWEFLTPIEPPHGPARLTAEKRPHLIGNDNAAAVILPDGRLWTDRIIYEPDGRFMNESNWLSVAPGFVETVAVRSDGTLWVSAHPLSWSPRDRRGNFQPNPDKLVQFGDQTDWQAVVWDRSSRSVVLLKTNGTLWRWGTNHFDSHLKWEGLRSFVPYRLGTNSDWSEILASENLICAWKQNGEAWVISTIRAPVGVHQELEPGKIVARCEDFDNKRWTCLTKFGVFQAGVLNNGTLWSLGQYRWKTGGSIVLREEQLGHDSNWVAVASYGPRFAALKSDGSLWRWDITYSQSEQRWVVSDAPARLGIHSDWLALGTLFDGSLSLAADGSLWFWQGYDHSDGQPLLGLSRRPTKIAELVR